ncbi:cysteine--1-D-myo-inosityl 2-amino-2-deoxy-alpha-D-glucopyranoside ligase [Falsarthrobacter nasiphocae]|uniref:L-cysteine:1D-myo-inositol 2-amino-2-deoxy-alpha-D-glucopyranoside ligase n=1 Tax=Falsarthrobacter nasiphocae TaxID=189863 RepID=A0AAE4C643_9MICC|nr:cysteine--1-D-myo-inosityl 2-amino-2-deoxy-alpha-D-glucopyranoside ligase [Falsarthrobacter nasiphocae]MDR6891114.1 L-cysteine:1D-myo-inositol 2-amino-2-deoxy-alpha-D-glucopyranoside ligase [Falsarthrobacter nasiphocae]
MRAWSTAPIPRVAGRPPRLTLWDTAQQRLVEPETNGKASLYVCGITPYDATHMGHAATYVAFDLLVRQWRDAGHDVTYVQNVTDVDDPLLERANATGADWRELAREQTDLFREDMEALNVVAPQHYVGAVESVPLIVEGVEHLVAEGVAYTVPGHDGEPDGDVYFDIEAAQRIQPHTEAGAWVLGQVSGYSREDMLRLSAERGGDPERPGKRGPLDPLLWRVARPGEPAWDGASLGEGRPGWHIECCVIARRLLPAPFTVQAGGSDLTFPHHEMSAAHAYAADGVPLARHYAHAAMVGLDGEKMSKSRGNLVFVSVLRREGTDPAAIRLALLSQRYREDWFWSDDVLAAAKTRLARWREAFTGTAWTAAEAERLIAEIRAALANDLDAPAALVAVDAALTRHVPTQQDEGSQGIRDALDALLGIRL